MTWTNENYFNLERVEEGDTLKFEINGLVFWYTIRYNYLQNNSLSADTTIFTSLHLDVPQWRQLCYTVYETEQPKVTYMTPLRFPRISHGGENRLIALTRMVYVLFQACVILNSQVRHLGEAGLSLPIFKSVLYYAECSKKTFPYIGQEVERHVEEQDQEPAEESVEVTIYKTFSNTLIV